MKVAEWCWEPGSGILNASTWRKIKKPAWYFEWTLLCNVCIFFANNLSRSLFGPEGENVLPVQLETVHRSGSSGPYYLGQLLSLLLVSYSLLWLNWLFPISFRPVPSYSTAQPWKCAILQVKVLLHLGRANNILGIPEISVTPTGSTCEIVCQFILKLSTLQQVTQRTMILCWSDLVKSFRRCTWHNTNVVIHSATTREEHRFPERRF